MVRVIGMFDESRCCQNTQGNGKVEAAAFGRPCAIYGERVEAAVCLRDGATVTAQDLRALCEARLGQFKSPDRVHVLDGLPKGPSGKIQRRRLADICPAV